MFLGFTITKEAVSISWKSYSRAMTKVKELIKRRTHVPLEHQIIKVNQWYQGWSAYYQQTSYPSQLHGVEAHIRRRFRAQLVSNQKRPRTLVKKFISLGVRKATAKWIAYSNRKCWALSITSAAHKAWSNEWFRTQGLLTVSNKKLPHWQPLRIWIKPV